MQCPPKSSFRPALGFIGALFFLTLFLLTQSVPAQIPARPKGFAQIPWGASVGETLRTLADRYKIVFPEELPTGDKIEVEGGFFSEEPVLRWTLEFRKGGLVAGSILIRPRANPVGTYRNFRDLIIQNYGRPNSEGRPGRGRARVESNHLGNFALWKFDPNISDKESKSILCQLATEAGTTTADPSALLILLRYANETLLDSRKNTQDAPKAPRKFDF
jgi:hypothetical protein